MTRAWLWVGGVKRDLVGMKGGRTPKHDHEGERNAFLSSNQAYTGVLWKTKKKKVGLILVLVSVQNSIPENFVR